jgi:adenylate cyclase
VASEPVERKLAAILAVDVAGYSRLMGEDETATAHAVREHREAVRPIVTTHGGRMGLRCVSRPIERLIDSQG